MIILGDWLGWVIGGIILVIIGYILQRHVAQAIIKTIGHILWIIGLVLIVVGIILLIFGMI
jgi:hypothetical protein